MEKTLFDKILVETKMRSYFNDSQSIYNKFAKERWNGDWDMGKISEYISVKKAKRQSHLPDDLFEI